MNGAVGLPAKDDVLTENLMLKKNVKNCCMRWLKFQIGIYVLLVKLQHIILVKFQKNKNRKKEYLSFA